MYKRQPYGYVVNAFRYLLKQDLEQTFYLAMNDVMRAVSYTHLDVYKRQAKKRDGADGAGSGARKRGESRLLQ